jgi:hypothetical protein
VNRVKRGVAAVLVLGVLGLLADVFAGPLFFVSTRTSEPEVRAGRMIGAVEGTIKGADASTGTVRMPSGFLGLLSLAVLVTEQTKIVVADKLGGFGDLEPGRIVHITYEVVRDRLVARRIDVRDALAPDAAFAAPKLGDEGDEKPVVSVAVPAPAASRVPTPPAAALVPVPGQPAPPARAVPPASAPAPAAPPAPPASLSGARPYGTASPPAKRVVSPPATTRPRVTKPRRPEGPSKAPAAAAKPPARKPPPRPQ